MYNKQKQDKKASCNLIAYMVKYVVNIIIFFWWLWVATSKQLTLNATIST